MAQNMLTSCIHGPLLKTVAVGIRPRTCSIKIWIGWTVDSQQWTKENPPLTGQLGRHEEVQQGCHVAQKWHKFCAVRHKAATFNTRED